MINNNRQSGRRRGRGGQRQQGGNPSGNNGNRIDNRARGNANQLYEKYKTLAADAQRQGDRVNTEYYLQFADHYFRVLAESRSRFEEQNPNQNQNRGRQDAFDDEDEGFDEDGNEVAAEAEQPRRQQQQRDDRNGQDRGNRNNGQDRNGRDRDRGNQIVGTGTGPFNGHLEDDEPAAVEVSEEREEERQPQPQPTRRPRQRREPRAEARPVEASEGETIDASALPPSLGFSLGTEADVEEVAPRPRRRTRRPANETTDAADAAE